MITESIVTTIGPDGAAHLTPMGVIWQDGQPILAPFRPSSTLANLEVRGSAAINLTDDVRIFAGCLTGRRDWPVVPCQVIEGLRLAASLTHLELVIERIEPHDQRPRFHGRIVHEGVHAPFRGFNRAQAAVLEAAILVSRLSMLPADKIERELAYLTIAVSKTAGPLEQEAWEWLSGVIAEHLAGATP